MTTLLKSLISALTITVGITGVLYWAAIRDTPPITSMEDDLPGTASVCYLLKKADAYNRHSVGTRGNLRVYDDGSATIQDHDCGSKLLSVACKPGYAPCKEVFAAIRAAGTDDAFIVLGGKFTMQPAIPPDGLAVNVPHLLIGSVGRLKLPGGPPHIME